MKLRSFLLAWLCLGMTLHAQEYFPKNDGVSNKKSSYTAFTGAVIHVSPTEIIENGTLLIKDGTIVATGTQVNIPENAIVKKVDGKHIYPSFIDLYSDFGVAQPQRAKQNNRPQYDAAREGYYWNDHIIPDQKAVEHFSYDKKKAEAYLKSGFGVLNAHKADGIMRGTSVLVALNHEGDNNERILKQDAAQHMSLSRSVATNQSYPSSLMGSLALIRQVYHDAKWYEQEDKTQTDLALEALLANRQLPVIFEANDKLNALRADKIADQFGLNFILKGGGDEFERADAIAATGAAFIIPVNYPDAYDVSDPYQTDIISLADMRMWNQAPSNPAVLASKGVEFSFTTADLKKKNEFLPNIRKAVTYGLNKEQALAALTTIPARLIGMQNTLGTLNKGYQANFLITSGDLFDNGTSIYENWVQGNPYTISDMNIKDIRGAYTLTVNGTSYDLNISGDLNKLKTELKKDSTVIASKINYTNGWVNIFYTPEGEGETQFVRLNAAAGEGNDLSGQGVLTNGKQVAWTAKKQEATEEKGSGNGKEAAKPEILPLTYPNMAYGLTEAAKKEDVLFKNATVWTSEEAGILENTDVLVKDGKIAAIGKDLEAGNARVIDATGKHLTAGIIDEHSHIAAASINEGGHNSSAEVKIEDVVDPEDIDIYRNLSGGVTTIQILHGSANPIGGRSALIKLKWGEDADDMILDQSPKFIKFALGENVKQSNWGAYQTVRFPQSRMGVEQVFTDYFQRAKEYDEAWKAYNALSKKQRSRTKAPRYDEEMETLAEIINGERFISCHSYVQSEINMLMKVAEKFGFRVNTFTHILEGYKVADKMAEHGVGGSTFSDWWAYKYEVKDAIPYNAAIMHNQGVTVAINSDDAEMSRRLNQEAAKTVKYGGMSEEEAWKFVTLNPAKLLHIDNRTGSIKEGKDADLVLWSDHPMSIYAIAEKTMIEGTVYYDHETMEAMYQKNQEERNRLINMMLAAKNKGMRTKAPEKKEKIHLHCDSEIYQK
ncbi:amidohydrolase family protein [Robertkochia sediminum]|uniref:amidohydrolase family protein n=1 Tax=Robertkochia sediminum TaxID=2785326 RepID=UPI001931A4DB|nr:amidohydrolase family protein [Robertkochia sediminum]MBL7472146.1 amidohydrolase family protein [Robertkochia sediminum]